MFIEVWIYYLLKGERTYVLNVNSVVLQIQSLNKHLLDSNNVRHYVLSEKLKIEKYISHAPICVAF